MKHEHEVITSIATPQEWDACLFQVALRISSGFPDSAPVHLMEVSREKFIRALTVLEGTLKVMCLIQEHNTKTHASAQSGLIA